MQLKKTPPVPNPISPATVPLAKNAPAAMAASERVIPPIIDPKKEPNPTVVANPAPTYSPVVGA